MAKRANYGFVKRQKELQKQQRKNEKAEKKRLKAESAGAEEQDANGENGGLDPDASEESPAEDANQG